MIGNFNCIYETPCGWCSKWDKECDKKIRKCVKNCSHEWEPSNSYSNSGYVYICKLCGETKIDSYSLKSKKDKKGKDELPIIWI